MTRKKNDTIVQTTDLADDQKRIVVIEDMIASSVEKLESRLLDEMAQVPLNPVIVDLRGVKKIDAGGISLCIGLKKECDIAKRALTLEMSQELFKTFKKLNLVEFLSIKEATDA